MIRTDSIQTYGKEPLRYILRRVPNHVYFIGLLLAWPMFGFAAKLTPSSYGVILRHYGVANAAPAFGESRGWRGDEYCALTPYFQAAVNNKFERFNATSPYKEDLRNFWALPLKDWSLVFKPQMWMFFTSSPGTGYAWYWAFLSSSFLVGFYVWLVLLGARPVYAFLGAIALFFSGMVQLWWTVNAPTFCFLPWIGVAFLGVRRWPWLFLAGLYAVAVWLFGQVYPPWAIMGAIATLGLTALLRPDSMQWRRTVVFSLGCALGAAVLVFYLRDVIPVMMSTTYPGKRVLPGGGVGALQYLSHFVPFLSTQGFEPLKLTIGSLTFDTSGNQCEASVVGTFLALFALVFGGRELGKVFGASRWGLVLFGLCFIVTSSWALFEIPADVGGLVGFNKFSGHRCLWGIGLLIQVPLLVAVSRGTWRFGWRRAVILGFVFVAIVSIKLLASQPASETLAFDRIALPILVVSVAVAYWLVHKSRHEHAKLLVVTACALINVVVFSGYNPWHSARQIFRQQSSPTLDLYRKFASLHEKGWLTIPAQPGATLNGLGFASLDHAPMAPTYQFFKPYYPFVPDDVLQNVFNRYAAVELAEVQTPGMKGLAAHVPIEDFGIPIASRIADDELSIQGGKIEGARIEESLRNWPALGTKRVWLRGRAEFSGASERQELWISSSKGDVVSHQAFRLPNLDDASGPHWAAGFLIAVDILPHAQASDDQVINGIEVSSFDPEIGVRELGF